MTVRTERLWDAGDVQSDIADALRIVAELEPPEDLRAQVFSAAVQALMQRQVIAPASALGLPTMAIPGGGRQH